MTTIALEAVDKFLTRLYADYKIVAACVGGAARDTYLGRTPKDYDFAFLDTGGRDRAGVLDALVDIFGGVVDLEGEGSADSADQRNLLGVWEARCPVTTAGYPFQFLLYDEETTASFQRNAAHAVVLHDCSLNHAWLAKVNGRIVARVTDEFPNPATGNRNFFAAHTSSQRKLYIRSKFPEFQHCI